MKNLIILAVIALAFGCAGVETVKPNTVIITLVPEGCIQSTLDNYSYQSAMDPKTIHNDWILVRDLSIGDFMLAELVYLNPIFEDEISVAILLVQGGAFTGLVYLCEGEPELYYFDGNSGCYEKVDIGAEGIDHFKKRLFEVLGGERI